jgi:hypothetical protein
MTAAAVAPAIGHEAILAKVIPARGKTRQIEGAGRKQIRHVTSMDEGKAA